MVPEFPPNGQFGQRNHSKAGRGALVLTILSVSLSCAESAAWAQLAGGGLTDATPATTGVGAGSFRDAVSSILSAPTRVSQQLPWTLSGAVDASVGLTDSPGGQSGDLQPFMLLAPDLNLNGVTSRLNVALSYSPRFDWYPSSSGQSYLSHNFNGDATAVVVPDWLYFNVRGVTNVSSRFGYSSLNSNSFYTANEAVQTSSFSATPYLQRQIGGWGVLKIGYTYGASFQSGYGTTPSFFNSANSAATAGYGSTTNLQTNTEFASFTTGENLGRVQDSIGVTASQNSGSTFYNGSTTFSVSNTLSYALYRWLTLLASGGYEEYDYPSSGYRLSQPTWSVGATVAPNADSSITVRYGQTAGINTVLFDGSYSPTARTRVYGKYDVSIQTGLGFRQGLLGSTGVGVSGLLVDSATGFPVLNGNYLSSQFPLSRVKTLTFGGVLQLDRDALSASLNYTQTTQLVASTSVVGVTTGAGTSTDSTFAVLSWQHDLNPSNYLNSSVSYGISNNGVYFGAGNTSQETVEVYTSYNHIFTDTLTGRVSYSHAERLGDAIRNLPSYYGGSASQNTFLVGLRKSF